MTRRRKPLSKCCPEPLETRTLMTVNVAFNAGNGLLKITGDGNANNVRIDETGLDFRVDVFVDNVLINRFAGVRDIKANMKGGDDDLSLNSVVIQGNLNAKMGDGADELDIDGQSALGGSLIADFGDDAGDFADFDDQLQVAGNVSLRNVADVDMNGDGVNNTAEADDIFIRGDLQIDLSGKGDIDADGLEIDLDNVNVFGETEIDGSDEIDRVEITDSQFRDDFEAEMDDGNDTVDIDNGAGQKNEFRAAAIFDGGDDIDTLFLGVDNLFAQPEVIEDFETVV